MDITKKLKDNISVIIALCTIVGVGISVINFFILVNVAPLQKEVIANGDEIEKVKTLYMPLDLSQEKWKNNDKEHTDMLSKLDNIDKKLDRLLYK